MRRLLFFLVVALVLTAPMNANASLIGKMDGSLAGGTRGTCDSLQVEICYGIFYESSGPILFNLNLLEGDSGNTYTVSSGTDFDAVVAKLTDGIDDFMTREVSVGLGGGATITTESNFLTFSDTSDPSRVDFSGYNINSFPFELNSLTFHTYDDEFGDWTDYDLDPLVTLDVKLIAPMKIPLKLF